MKTVQKCVNGRESVKGISKKHVFFYKLLRPPVILFLKATFGYRYKKAENLPENYIVISNHSTDFDPLFVAASFPEQMYFVGSEHIARWKTLYKLLKFAFEPIMRHKGASAGSAVMEMIKRVKKGASVCLFAEGVRTWDGSSSPIDPSTAKMIRRLGCGLVTYKIVGGYFASPMWGGDSIRRGYVYGAPVHVFTKEQLSAMTNEELYEIIREDLWEDAYARQQTDPKKYRGRHLAKKLENLLFVCPQCGKRDTFHSAGDTATCSACGLQVRYNEYGMLEGIPFRTAKELLDWQKEQVADDVEKNTVYTAGKATLCSIKNHQETLAAEGAVELSTESLKCGEIEIQLEEISELSMRGQRAVLFTVGKTYYELIPEAGFNALKFMLYFNEHRQHMREKVG